MRERHFPRLCRSCHAPMARQEDTCWSCEAQRRPAPAAIGKALAVAQARLDVDRWADEGGSLAAEESRRVGARIAAVQ
ncbi:MAG TPA: hypothetical protein VFI54_12570 [Solirubrobacteraceae bacterium]|nr:hypothetical protein [Solirubrobacteraceae bacterium]